MIYVHMIMCKSGFKGTQLHVLNFKSFNSTYIWGYIAVLTLWVWGLGLYTVELCYVGISWNL